MRLQRVRSQRRLRLVAGITIAAFTTTCAIRRWEAVPLTQVDVEREATPERLVHVQTASGRLTLAVTGIDYPYVEGRPKGGQGEVLVDLRKVRETREVGRTMVGPPDASAPALAAGREVQLATDSGLVTLRVRDHRPPFVRGDFLGCVDPQREQQRRAQRDCGIVRLDFRDVQQLEVARVAKAETTLVNTLLVGGGLMAGLALLVALTKESCPFVYAGDPNAPALVGEAYAGAAFRSLKRDDLLPLPAARHAGPYRVMLRNEARETQWTDRAELVVVDHPVGTSVLATSDARWLAVGPLRPPNAAHDDAGVERLAAVHAPDAAEWSVTPLQLAEVSAPAARSGLTLRFSPAERPVLVLRIANTFWLDLVFGRFFAAMGHQLAAQQRRWGAPEAGPRLLSWKDREGVDLRVETRVAGEWARVASVPTVGPVALREVAVPLPASTGDALEVRVSGGQAFWRIDSARLASAIDVPLEERTLQPRRAIAQDGSDARPLLAATDDDPHALSAIDEELVLDFELPPAPRAGSRTLFLSTNGYYHVHPPVDGRHFAETVRAVQRDLGGLSRFSVALAREYARRSARTAEAGGRSR